MHRPPWVASLVNRWILRAHHGSVQPGRLGAYRDEFVFRFSCRLQARAAGCLTGCCSKPSLTNR